jgi:uncharacterized oligopeptide transporter (OPT) family protein
MIKKGVRTAALTGGLIVMVLMTVILAIVIILLVAPPLMELIELVIALAIVGFLSGFLTVRLIMGQMLKQFMPLIESLMAPAPKKK